MRELGLYLSSNINFLFVLEEGVFIWKYSIKER